MTIELQHKMYTSLYVSTINEVKKNEITLNYTIQLIVKYSNIHILVNKLSKKIKKNG